MSLGAIVAPRIQNIMSGRMIFAIGGGVYSLVYIMLGILPQIKSTPFSTIIYFNVIMFINGVIDGIIGVIYNSIFITNIDKGYISRITGIFGAMSISAIPISSFLFAGLSSFLDILTIYFIGAIITFIIYMSVFIPKEFKKI